jgi:hypothetical protein
MEDAINSLQICQTLNFKVSDFRAERTDIEKRLPAETEEL